MRIHAFLEHWGLINFNLESANKINKTFHPKVFNFKSPVYLNLFNSNSNSNNAENKGKDIKFNNKN